jgi:hypothetical protein
MYLQIILLLAHCYWIIGLVRWYNSKKIFTKTEKIDDIKIQKLPGPNTSVALYANQYVSPYYITPKDSSISIPINQSPITILLYNHTKARDGEILSNYTYLDKFYDQTIYLNTDAHATQYLLKYDIDATKFQFNLPLLLLIKEAKSDLYYATVYDTSHLSYAKYTSYSKEKLIAECASVKRLPLTLTVMICSIIFTIFTILSIF